MQFVQVG